MFPGQADGEAAPSSPRSRGLTAAGLLFSAPSVEWVRGRMKRRTRSRGFDRAASHPNLVG